MRAKGRCWVLLLFFSLPVLGCDEDWQAKTVPATGRVTINGQPPEGAIVHLYPVDEKADIRNSRPWGIVQEDGTYRLSTYERDDGAPPGTYKFTIKWPFDYTKPSTADRLNHRFDSPEESQWTVTVEPDKTELEPIALTGVQIADQPGSSPTTPAPMPGMSQSADRKQ